MNVFFFVHKTQTQASYATENFRKYIFDRMKTILCVCVILVPPDGNLSPEQHALLRDLLAKSKEKLRRLTTDHREVHGSVSKVGKTIDRNFVSDLSSTTKTDVLLEEHNIHLLNKVIAQHFYRQGMDDVADTLVQVNCFYFLLQHNRNGSHLFD